jgi:hypothetical protein
MLTKNLFILITHPDIDHFNLIRNIFEGEGKNKKT